MQPRRSLRKKKQPFQVLCGARLCTARLCGARLCAALMCAALMFALAGCQSLWAQDVTDLSRLQGEWVGKGPGGPCTVTIRDKTLHFQAREDFWYETTFVLLTDTEPKQLHATIQKDSSTEQKHIGTVVVALFEFEDEKLTLGVVDDFEEPPTEPVEAHWDWLRDIYDLERAESP